MIPDMALLAIGQYARYQHKTSDMLSAPAESTWCAESLDPSNSLSESLQFTSVAPLSPLSELRSMNLRIPPQRVQKRSNRPKVQWGHPPEVVPRLSPGTYPYTRPEAKKDVDGVKRRKVRDHMFERRLLTPEEL